MNGAALQLLVVGTANLTVPSVVVCAYCGKQLTLRVQESTGELGWYFGTIAVGPTSVRPCMGVAAEHKRRK